MITINKIYFKIDLSIVAQNFWNIGIDENGLWTNLKTHDKTDYVRIFNFVYDIFNSNFATKNTLKKFVMRLPENER